MLQPFYIIGHNPNRVEEAVDFLRRGANALEPDIHWNAERGVFQVSHFAPSEEDPTLEQYLHDLAQTLSDLAAGDPSRLTLTLIAFDLKPDYNYDPQHLFEIIRTCFSDRFPQVAILTTVASPEDMPFLARMRGKLRENEAIGVDEATELEDARKCFGDAGIRYTFADGIDVLEFPPMNAIVGPKSYLEKIGDALSARDAGAPGAPHFVYTWCVNGESDLRAFLDLEPAIDAILTDKSEVLHALLQEPKYKEKFRLAVPGELWREGAPKRSRHHDGLQSHRELP